MLQVTSKIFVTLAQNVIEMASPETNYEDCFSNDDAYFLFVSKTQFAYHCYQIKINSENCIQLVRGGR